MQTQLIKRPSLGLYFTEFFRAVKETIKSTEFRKTYQPQKTGAGHPILVIPGFLADDISCKPLRSFLNRIGYVAYPWELGRNYANLKDLEVLKTTIDTIYQKHQTKISIIGWSLGGVYARELAKENPNIVSQIITLGSPFAGIQEPNNATWIYNLLKSKKTRALDQKWMATLPHPAPVPTLAIYSVKDGIVPYQVCKELKETATHKNLEVKSSHLGMGYNKEVLEIIAERLPIYSTKKNHNNKSN